MSVENEAIAAILLTGRLMGVAGQRGIRDEILAGLDGETRDAVIVCEDVTSRRDAAIRRRRGRRKGET